MRVALATALLVLCGLYPASGFAAPPSNDNFAFAEEIASFPFGGSVQTADASHEAGELFNCSIQRTVWYHFTAPTNGVVEFDTAGSSFADTAIEAWSDNGTGIGGLSLLPPYCVAFGGQLSFAVQAGKSYYLQAGDLGSGGGDLHVNAEFVTPPDNDDFANARTIASLPFSHTVDLTAATDEPGEPQACFFSQQTAWYTFTPEVDTYVAATMMGEVQNQSQLAVYFATSPGLGGLVNIACASGDAPTIFLAQAHTTYWLQAKVAGGTVTLEVPPPPPFDDIANAVTIPTARFSTSDDSARATASASDPDCFGRGHTVWYTFTPPEDMRLEARVQPQYPNEPPGLTLSAYERTRSSLRQLACSDNSVVVQGYQDAAIAFDAKAGVPIYFMVGTSGATPGGVFFFDLQRPLEIGLVIDKKGPVTPDGLATVSGSISCSRPIGNQALLTLISLGQTPAAGAAFSDFLFCSPQATRWSVSVMSGTGTPFRSGKTTATVQMTNQCDEQGCQPGALIGRGYGPIASATVNLHKT